MAIATVPVVRTDLSSTTQLSGTLGFAGKYSIAAPAGDGVLTALPEPGDVISQGQPAYEVDGSPVFLFYGARPQWRALVRGMSPGADVRELEQNLTDLGDASAATLTVDDAFTGATSLAIRRWQLRTGQEVTGEVAVGRVIYEPGPIRVQAVEAILGASAAAGQAVYTATSTTPVVSAGVPAGQTGLIHPGDAVTVTLPAGVDAPGRVDSISAVAVASSGNSGGGDGPSAGSGQPGQASVPALVTLTDPGAAAGLDQAPVTVNVTDRTVTGVLGVPVAALVALAGGGYGVWVDRAAGRELVGVAVGLFATTLVEVTAAGLQPGDNVEVPSS